jgi:hypothetical protein
VETHRKLLQPRVEGVSHVGLDHRPRLQHEPAAEPDHHGLEHAEPEHGGDRPPDLARIPVAERPVHERAKHLGDEQGHERGDERCHHAEVDPGHGRLRIGVEAKNRGEGAEALLVCRHSDSLDAGAAESVRGEGVE